MEKKWSSEFKSQAVYRLDESSRMVLKCMEGFTEEEVWQRPNPASNSVGNIMLHLCGNMSQYAVASLGRSTDNRNRELEFSTTSGYSRKQLVKMLSDTVGRVKRSIEECTEEQLLEQSKVQGFKLPGIGIILHVVEHYSYHVGQIAFWTKSLKDKDLGFYEGTDLNTRNKS